MFDTPLADFVINPEAHFQRLAESHEPEVLTVDGEAKAVLVDLEQYRSMVERLEKAELADSLRQAMKDIDDGLGIPFDKLVADLDAKYGV